jgi:tetratricopeptide (TPR) repeat protein
MLGWRVNNGCGLFKRGFIVLNQSWRWLMILVAVLGLAGSSVAFAETPVETARAMALIAEVLAGEGKADEALGLFERAYALDPAPTLLYNIGRLYDKKGDVVKARTYYEKYVSREPDSERRAKGQLRLDAVLDRIPGKLWVESNPPGASIEIDGNTVASSKTPATLDLVRGRHEVIVRLDNHLPERRTVVLNSGDEVRVGFALKVLAAQPSAPPVTSSAAAKVVVVVPATPAAPASPVVSAGRAVPAASAAPAVLVAPAVVPAPAAVSSAAVARPVSTAPSTAAAKPPQAATPVEAIAAVPARAVAAKPDAVPSAVKPSGASSRAAVQTVRAASGMKPMRIAAWTCIATGIAAAVAGGVTYGLGYGDYQAMNKLDWEREWDKVQSKFDSAKLKRDVSIGLWSVGGAALLTGIILYFVPDSKKAAVAPAGPGGTPGLTALVRW